MSGQKYSCFLLKATVCSVTIHYAIRFAKSILHSYMVEANLCLGHSIHLIYDSLDHNNLITVRYLTLSIVTLDLLKPGEV